MDTLEDTMDTSIEPKTSAIFECKKCYYFTCKRSNYDRHIATAKHCRIHFECALDEPFGANEPASNFACICGNVYKFSQGLSKHRRSCEQYIKHNELKKNDNTFKMLTDMVLEVVKQNKDLITLNTETQKQNQELTNKIVEIYGTTTIHNTQNNLNHSNNNNKTFNLNMFLNETCKDAMNINEFVDSLQLQLSDLEEVGKLGFVEGISSIIVKNLKALDVHKRPVHCADKKREVIYIKDENKWEKENEEKLKLRKAIKRIAYKNEKLLPKFKELHPGCNFSASKYADHYSKLVIEALGGAGDNDAEKQDKIIKNIAKAVIIDKSDYQ
jgi:hypothetical protein